MSKLQVAYLRVSTETQTEKYGLDMQKQKIMDYCEKHGITIDKWYIDGGYSGSKLDRPEIQELLKHAKSGIIDTVYIYKLDRMSRDVIDTLTLFYKTLPGYGVKVVSMTEELRTENPMDRMMLTMNAAMNQYEREVIRMRMSSGMVERVKMGFGLVVAMFLLDITTIGMMAYFTLTIRKLIWCVIHLDFILMVIRVSELLIF